ncbi:MAG: hypothetical protein HY420_00660 [Candidatus Kerfeldbacteria bacterium]|nr:hypothetical protein [Candidatus Kerfeldbacteria bacterium]
MRTLIQRLTKIGVSEFVLIFLLVLAMGGVFALMSTNVNFQVTILPPPPPTITTILGDPQTRAVLVIGTSLPNATVRVYAFSDPIFVETKADAEGAFLAAFTEDVLAPGTHNFSAVTVLPQQQTTDPTPKVGVTVAADYKVEPAAGSAAPTVKIGNADAATSSLIRTIIRNQESAKAVAPDDVPPPDRKANRALIIQIGLFAVIALETLLLLMQRARRKAQAGQSFFHLGRGLYRLPHSRDATAGHLPNG